MTKKLTLTPVARLVVGHPLNKADDVYADVTQRISRLVQQTKNLGFAAECQCYIYESQGRFGWLKATPKGYSFTGMVGVYDLSVVFALLANGTLHRTNEQVSPVGSAPGTLLRLEVDVPPSAQILPPPQHGSDIAAFLYEWHTRTADSGFDGLYTAENSAQTYSWLYERNRHSPHSTQNVAPEQHATIKAMLASGLLQADDAGQRLLLNDGLARVNTRRQAAPVNVRSFLERWRRFEKNTDFRGLCHQDLSRNPYQKQPYTWVWYAGMGENDFVDVKPSDVATIEYMLKKGMLKRGLTYRRPLVDNGEQVVTGLTLVAGLLPG